MKTMPLDEYLKESIKLNSQLADVMEIFNDLIEEILNKKGGIRTAIIRRFFNPYMERYFEANHKYKES
jgi:hypothetical protein